MLVLLLVLSCQSKTDNVNCCCSSCTYSCSYPSSSSPLLPPPHSDFYWFYSIYCWLLIVIHCWFKEIIFNFILLASKIKSNEIHVIHVYQHHDPHHLIIIIILDYYPHTHTHTRTESFLTSFLRHILCFCWLNINIVWYRPPSILHCLQGIIYI